MKNKVFGVLTPIVTVVVLIGLGVVLALTSDSGDGWAALGALIMAFMLTGLVLVIMFVVALVLYIKKKSDYALGIIYGLIGLFLVVFVTGILNATFGILS